MAWQIAKPRYYLGYGATAGQSLAFRTLAAAKKRAQPQANRTGETVYIDHYDSPGGFKIGETKVLPRSQGNPRKVKGHSTTLRNMASVTIRKLPNGVVKITGRKMAANPGKAKRAKRSSDAHLFRQAGDKRYKRPTSMARWHSGRASSERRGQYRKAPIYRNGRKARKSNPRRAAYVISDAGMEFQRTYRTKAAAVKAATRFRKQGYSRLKIRKR